MLLTRRTFAAGLCMAPMLKAAAATPKRRWTVYVIQHSHIDNGFTERQELVAEYHAQFVRQAIALARSAKQKDRSIETRFKFTFEGFWEIEQFLKRAAPAEKEELAESLRSGDLELSGSYFNLVDLADRELLNRSVGFAAAFARREKVPLRVAMLCDVNGVALGLAEAFVSHGINRLSTNINPDQGGYPFGKPLVPFHWETPGGKRLLVWNGLAYHKANLFGVMGGSVPAGDPGIPGLILPGVSGYVHVTDTSVAESKLLPFLAWLEESGYPYDSVPLMGSGTYTDNSPPGDTYCDIIARWNERFGSQVRLCTSTLTGFFSQLEKHSDGIPTYRGEWTNWWDDNAASAPNDTVLYRNAVRNRRLISVLDSKKGSIPAAELDDIDRQLLAYAEHTFGYSKTAVPSLLGEQVFARKSQYATNADILASAAVDRLLMSRGLGPFTADQPFGYLVLNPYSVPKQDVVGLPVNFWEAPFLQGGIRVLNESGATVPHQVEQSARGWNVFVMAHVPAGETARFRLVPDPTNHSTESDRPDSSNTFENSFYKLAWSANRGVVSYSSLGRELLDVERGGLGCPVYQIFPGANRSAAGAVSGKRVRPHDEVTFGQCLTANRLPSGSLFQTFEFAYSILGTTKYVLQLRCFHDLPEFEVTAHIIKTEVDDPEGLYIHFPLAIPNSRWVLDKTGGPIRPGLDQIPGTCCDYYTVLSGAALVGEGIGVAWTALDAPLIQIGDLNLWRFTTATDGKGPLYSWITNNKWQTNTRYRCAGAYEMRYKIAASDGFANSNRAIDRCRELASSLIVMRR